MTGIPFLCHTEEQRLLDALVQKHKDIDAKNSAHQFSSPAFTSPAGNQAGVTKGPLNVTAEQQSFLDDIW